MGNDLNLKENNTNIKKYDEDGDNHVMSSIENLITEDAFELTDQEKIEIIQEYFKNIMLTLGLDLSDDNLRGTPYRVAKMYVKEIFKGLKPVERPKIMLFENKFQ